MDKDKRIFFTLGVFVILAVFLYVFSGVVGVNVPRYYPETHEWKTFSEASFPSVGYYGKLLVTIPLAAVLSIIFYLILPAFSGILEKEEAKYQGAIKLSLLFGSLYFVGHEWHRWGIQEAGLDTNLFWNSELNFFLFLLVLYVVLAFILSWAGSKIGE